VPKLILAAVTPDNTPHGYNLTFAAPMLTFVIIGAILYFLFSRPHRRIPPQPLRLSAGRPVPSSTATGRGVTTAGPTAAAGAGDTATADAPAAEAPAAEAPAAEAPAAEAPAAEAPAADEPTAESNGSAQGEAAPGPEDTE
jgi:hypothetical protein